MRKSRTVISLLCSVAAGTASVSALAQESAAEDAASEPEGTGSEIIVTARKRNETAVSTPITMTVVSQAQLEALGGQSLDNLNVLVPQLQVSDAAGSLAGGTITLRGIASGEGNGFADQAVSFAIDGVQVARASVRRMALVDAQQVEVLKGPQSLFYGKNSPGGIISIRTADPTDQFEGKALANYGFVGRDKYIEGVLSGPISEDVGLRIVGYGNILDGWIKNVAPENGSYTPKDRRLTDQSEFGGRVTVLADLTPNLEVRAKLNYASLKNAGIGAAAQLVFCPLGAPRFGDVDDCIADNKIVRGDLGTSIASTDTVYRDGAPYLEQRQVLGSVEANYALGDGLKLTSVTGYYDLNFQNSENYTQSANFIISGAGIYGITELSQELRLTSDWNGPVNFMVGALLNSSDLDMVTLSHIDGDPPTLALDLLNRQDGDAWSVFSQLTLAPTDYLDVAVGGRYSSEKKSLESYREGVFLAGTASSKKWTDFSPDLTVRLRPDPNTTLYASYREGFTSGGFNGASVSPAFDPQYVKGFEGGLKASVLDRTLNLQLAAYSYELSGLQVTTLELLDSGPVQVVRNAGESTIKGVEADLNWVTPVDGLRLRAAGGYNRAKFTEFTSQCYKGQTIALGCNIGETSPGQFALQDLAGTQILRAPKWTANFGADLDRWVSNSLSLVGSFNASYSSKFQTQASYVPTGVQEGYWLLDASIGLRAESGWGVSLIGSNLTNEYYFTRSQERIATGGGQGTNGPAELADLYAGVSRGREIRAQVSYEF